MGVTGVSACIAVLPQWAPDVSIVHRKLTNAKESECSGNEINRGCLSWGASAKVLTPPALINSIAEELKEIRRNYDMNPNSLLKVN